MTIRAAALLLLLAKAAAALGQAPAAPALRCSIAPISNTAADQAFAAGDSARAESLFATQLAAASTPAAYAGLVRVQLDQDKLAEALATANRAVAAFPASAEAVALLGDVNARSGNIVAASDAYLKALSLDRCSAHAHLGFSRLNQFASHHDAAAKEAGFAHRLAPADPEITANFIASLPSAEHLAPLRALLAQHPALPPAQLRQLTTDLAILEQHLTCTAQPFPSASLTLLPILQNGRERRSWGLKVGLNDVSTPLLELDTSVHGIVLSASDAARANLRPLIADSAPGDPYTAAVGRIVIGSVAYRDCPVTVVPDDLVDKRNSLIGADFFRDHLININYVAMTLGLAPLPDAPAGAPPAAASKDWTPVYIAGPAVLVPTLINKKGPFLFALDTGSRHTLLSPAVTSAELSKAADATLNLQGVSGPIIKVIARDGGGVTDIADVRSPQGKVLPVSRPVKLPVLQFGGNQFPDESCVAFDISPYSHAAGTEVSGLLGFSLLSYFTLDLNYRDGLARIVFDQNRRYHVRETDLNF